MTKWNSKEIMRFGVGPIPWARRQEGLKLRVPGPFNERRVKQKLVIFEGSSRGSEKGLLFVEYVLDSQTTDLPPGWNFPKLGTCKVHKGPMSILTLSLFLNAWTSRGVVVAVPLSQSCNPPSNSSKNQRHKQVLALERTRRKRSRGYTLKSQTLLQSASPPMQ